MKTWRCLGLGLATVMLLCSAANADVLITFSDDGTDTSAMSS